MLALIAISLQALGTPGAPVFTFKEYEAGRLLDEKLLKGCKDTGDGILMCQRVFSTVAGVDAPVGALIYNSKLSYLRVRTAAKNYSALRDAFTTKYGQSCANGTEDVQNRMGAHFKSRTETWCFASGKLKLREIAESITIAGADYVDDHAPPRSTPKIDF